MRWRGRRWPWPPAGPRPQACSPPFFHYSIPCDGERIAGDRPAGGTKMHRSNVGRESAIQRQARHGRFRRSKLRAAPRTTIHTAAMRGAATTGWGCACTFCTVGILAQGTHRAVVNAKRAFATAASATSSRVQSAATITAAVFGSRLGFGDLPGCRRFGGLCLNISPRECVSIARDVA